MRAAFGTDTKCERQEQRIKAEQMIREAEARVDKLNNVLDQSPARDLDEALRQMSGER